MHAKNKVFTISGSDACLLFFFFFFSPSFLCVLFLQAKIDEVLNLIQNADPTGETRPDSSEMLGLEGRHMDQVVKAWIGAGGGGGGGE